MILTTPTMLGGENFIVHEYQFENLRRGHATLSPGYQPDERDRSSETSHPEGIRSGGCHGSRQHRDLAFGPLRLYTLADFESR